MTITAAADLSTEDLHAAVDHFVKRIVEIVTEADEVKKQLARVQQHVAVVDALNQAQARENSDLKLELHRRDATLAKVAARCSDLEQRLDRAQQEPKPVRPNWWSARIGNRL